MISNAKHIDTTPGNAANNMFAAPAEVQTSEEYYEYLKSRYRSDLQFKQAICFASRFVGDQDAEYSGPFVEPLTKALKSIKGKRH